MTPEIFDNRSDVDLVMDVTPKLTWEGLIELSSWLHTYSRALMWHVFEIKKKLKTTSRDIHTAVIMMKIILPLLPQPPLSSLPSHSRVPTSYLAPIPPPTMHTYIHNQDRIKNSTATTFPTTYHERKPLSKTRCTRGLLSVPIKHYSMLE